MSRAEEYLHEVRRHLYGIAPNRRRDVLDDLRAHFADAAELGLPTEEVIANLGSAAEVAERAREQLGGDGEGADAAWNGLVWTAVTTAVVIAVVTLFFPTGWLGADARLASPLLAAVPGLLAAAPLPFPRRMRTVATLAAATALTFACVIAGATVGVLFAPCALLLWAALVIWVGLRGDGFGPLWRVGAAVLTVAPLAWVPSVVLPALTVRHLPGAVAEPTLFSPTTAVWVIIGIVMLCAVLIALGIRSGGWMLATVGGALLLFALLAGGPLATALVIAGGAWLTIGLAHALATLPRD